MRRRAPFAAFFLLAALAAFVARPARAQRPSVAGELIVGAGHDTNAFLQVAPEQASGVAPARGPFFQAAPALVGALSIGGFRVALSYGGDYRALFLDGGAGHLYFQEGELELALPALGPLRLQLGGSAGTFAASRAREEAFRFVAGSAASRLQLGEALRVLGSYRVELRRFPSLDDQVDRLQAADARIAYRPSPRFELGPFGGLLHVVDAAGAGAGAFVRLRGGLESSAVVGRLVARATGWVGRIDVPGAASRRELGAAVEARVRLPGPADLVALIQFARAPGATARDPDLSRRSFLLGLVVHGTTTTALASAAPPRAPLRPTVTPTATGAVVRFRHRAPGAASVRLVGSWDDWSAPGQSLGAVAEGIWELTVELPPGAHRYRFLVDGRAARPMDAPRYQTDDFGGEDGVLDVTPGRTP